ncbi:hypothetical protein BaRGS_00022878 [Batillaria attramentaria]|uniref:Uncharacterized protein n=1 Tax=Batillaria attramentaria TaxID=370345 RepID=A0ABD0KFS4_9CAEN
MKRRANTPGEAIQQMEEGEQPQGAGTGRALEVLYKVEERPPWPLLLVLALQQFLTMFGATFSMPLLMAGYLCLEGDTVGLSSIISTVIFVSGVGTLLQTIFGVRLPIVQSISYGFVSPFIVLLTSVDRLKCPDPICLQDAAALNATNVTAVICGSDAHKDMWQVRIREIQGALLVSSLIQVVLGFSGLVGLLLNLIGPLTIAPTITMIGLSLFDSAAYKCEGEWWIALTTLALIAIFSQYLRFIQIPFCSYRAKPDGGRGCVRSSLHFFSLFPVLLAVCLAWLLCYILTETDVFPSDSKKWGYGARTDTKSEVLSLAPWFRFPYPGQWGVPTVSVAGVLGSLAATLASIVESVGDYYACARLSGAAPPPGSAVSRGIGTEGITSILAGAWGSLGGTTSYSENIGAIGITKVASRAVIQAAAVLMLILGCIGKFSAIFVTLPDPVVGGLFLAMFGMVSAVGLSNLQYVDLSSTRNLFVLGVSLFLGLTVPKWLAQPANANAIDTGSSDADQVLTVLCSTSMFFSGFVAFVLDNTIPGTREERGLLHWREGAGQGGLATDAQGDLDLTIYDLPLIQPWLNRQRLTSYLPFCPTFRGDRRRHKSPPQRASNGQINEAFHENHEVTTQL